MSMRIPEKDFMKSKNTIPPVDDLPLKKSAGIEMFPFEIVK